MAIDLVTIAAGTGGFVIHGQDAQDFSGYSVSSAGDINGDGFDDLIIGARGGDGPGNARNLAGDSYVVFGQASGFGAAIDLATIAAGTGGFVIHGQDANDRSGGPVSSAGDINGDGFDDLIIGAYRGDGPGNTRTDAGDSYVVFGKATSFGAAIDLATIAGGIGGFVLHGQDMYDKSGRSVSSAGDINGDGFDDLIIGAYGGDGPGNTRDLGGDSYVVFGQASGFGAAIDLATIAAGTGGFVIHGQDLYDISGFSVSSAGDINGDGFDDLIIGANGGAGPGNARNLAGDSYVVFGQAAGFGAAIDLATIAAGTGGFVIHGQDVLDRSGSSVSSAGDINGDGFDDLIIGASHGYGPGNARPLAGDSYVVFGQAAGFGAAIDLATIAAGTGGFVIHGQDAGDASGEPVSSAGDINGDGFDDLIIGARSGGGPANARNNAGDSYVVFGKASGFGAAIDLATIAGGIGGFVIHGQEAFDSSGVSVSSAGDIDGDGFDDLIIGATGGDGPSNARSSAGDSYVIFGSATVGGSADAVTHAGTTASETLTGTAGADVMVGGRGNDTLLGSGGADVLRGAEGNDTLTIADATFARVTGGTGTDVLAFSGAITLGDSNFRRIEGIESLKLGNGATSLTLGAVAANAIDGLASNGFQIAIDGSLVTSASVAIDGGALTRGLAIDLSNNANAVTLTGGAANDSFAGGDGNDTVIGGAGSDTAVFSGPRDSYKVTTTSVSGTLTTTVADLAGTDGTDTLTGVETLRFGATDFTFAGANLNLRGNVVGDRYDAVTFHNDATGQSIANVFTAGAVTSSGALTGNNGARWDAIDTADMNADGIADVIYKNMVDGRIAIGTMSETGVTAYTYLATFMSTTWRLVGAADMDGDGYTDLVVQNSANGNIFSADFTGLTFNQYNPVSGEGTAWEARALGDINRDGITDIIYQNTGSGDIVAGLMTSASTISAYQPIAGVGNWTVKEAADVNRDGYLDILIQNNADGDISYANMAGGTFSGFGTVLNGYGTAWQLEGMADTNNDGDLDAVIRNVTGSGDTYVVNMEAGAFQSFTLVAQGIGADWYVV